MREEQEDVKKEEDDKKEEDKKKEEQKEEKEKKQNGEEEEKEEEEEQVEGKVEHHKISWQINKSLSKTNKKNKKSRVHSTIKRIGHAVPAPVF